ncbi:MAG TPA: hypothetical protein VHA82_24235 [Ramlibacter sp.]|uniref:hypothetical protein n=1 Tax=Ramlibacter sp. TaxID=1917967 RepID=UPI002C24EA67|nr:hypothetical protein [Ramlibacter sp.]HVZ46938.1 hypothetical protein [Ramlibacter sp.]
MSFFSWFTGRKPAKPATAAESSGLSRMESTKPYPPRGPQDPNARPANRKSERMARRELLYTVVRETMAKSGVVSASYKFKVLSLDARGRQFLVMVDLAREYGSETSGLAEIEAMIAQMAKVRYDIVVTAVYWRMNEHVAVGINTGRHHGKASIGTAAAAPSQAAPVASQPMPVEAARETPPEAPPETPLAKGGARFEPIQHDEVEAFRQAFAQGVSGAAAMQAAAGATAKSFDGTMKHGPQSYTLLTGFEDTELAEDESHPMPGALSATQYGDLR